VKSRRSLRLAGTAILRIFRACAFVQEYLGSEAFGFDSVLFVCMFLRFKVYFGCDNAMPRLPFGPIGVLVTVVCGICACTLVMVMTFVYNMQMHKRQAIESVVVGERFVAELIAYYHENGTWPVLSESIPDVDSGAWHINYGWPEYVDGDWSGATLSHGPHVYIEGESFYEIRADLPVVIASGSNSNYQWRLYFEGSHAGVVAEGKLPDSLVAVDLKDALNAAYTGISEMHNKHPEMKAHEIALNHVDRWRGQLAQGK